MIKCFLGFHNWQYSLVVIENSGFAIGKKCIHCGVWHKTTLKMSWEEFYNETA